MTNNNLLKCIYALSASLLIACSSQQAPVEQPSEVTVEAPAVELKFGIPVDGYSISSSNVGRGETMGKILYKNGISAQMIDRLDRAAREIFPLRNIRAGQPYTLFSHTDSLGTDQLDYMVYQQSRTDYVRFGFHGDSVSVELDKKAIVSRRIRREAVIESSMWGAIMDAGLPYDLAAKLEDTYQWTVDFFGIQRGDHFTVIYDEGFVDDSLSVGINRILGAKFVQGGAEYYAIPFQQGDEVEYWEADGGSLRKQMLKAPLKYSRISSKFTYARLHPIYKVYRPHTGVDYAAPIGTPVVAVADGTVTFRGWGGGGGNTLKIKHPGNITTGYLHLKGYARGIVMGAHVKQGQVIGYVGSTGASTGPHLDYRVWRGTTPINPLTIPQRPTEPISEENMAQFELVKTRVINEIEGKLALQEMIPTIDSITNSSSI